VTQNLEGVSIAVDRDCYFNLGGHDEAFVGWGGEDNEMFERCRSVALYPFMYLPFIHLHHDPQPGKLQPAGLETKRLFEERSLIPAQQRILELSSRNFGRENQLDPPYLTD
jgi:hypothetical protein